MNLLEKDHNDEITISPHARSIPVFEDIWKRDDTEEKITARKEFSFIYFVADFRSNLIIYDEQNRRKEAKDTIFGEESSWEPDNTLEEAIRQYKEIQKTPSMELLESFIQATYRLKQYFDSVDFNERDKNGKPVHDVKKLMESMSKSHDLINNLTKLQEKVKQEQLEGERVRGGGTKGDFEDPEE